MALNAKVFASRICVVIAGSRGGDKSLTCQAEGLATIKLGLYHVLTDFSGFSKVFQVPPSPPLRSFPAPASISLQLHLSLPPGRVFRHGEHKLFLQCNDNPPPSPLGRSSQHQARCRTSLEGWSGEGCPLTFPTPSHFLRLRPAC